MDVVKNTYCPLERDVIHCNSACEWFDPEDNGCAIWLLIQAINKVGVK